MKTWRVMLQSVGVADLLLTLYGCYIWAAVALDVHRRPSPGEAPYFRIAFWTLSEISAAFLLAMVVASIMLVRVRPMAAITHTILFVALIASAFSPGSLWLLPNGVGASIAAASGVGTVAVGPLLFTLGPFVYPAISILCVNIAWWKIRGPTTVVASHPRRIVGNPDIRTVGGVLSGMPVIRPECARIMEKSPAGGLRLLADSQLSVLCEPAMEMSMSDRTKSYAITRRFCRLRKCHSA